MNALVEFVTIFAVNDSFYFKTEKRKESLIQPVTMLPTPSGAS